MGYCLNRRTPHPPLRTSRQWRARGEHRQGPRAARRFARSGGQWRRNCTECRDGRLPAMPLLRRAHDYHRGLRSRLHAQIPAARRSARLDRYVMMPLSPYPIRNTDCDRCWVRPGHDGARHKRPRRGSNSPSSTPAGSIPATAHWSVYLQKELNYPFTPAISAHVSVGALIQSP